MSGFIYNHGFVLSLMRTHTNNSDLLRPAVTRFATAFLILQSIHKKKDALRKVFTCDEWNKSKWSRDVKGNKVMETVLSTTFWNNIVYAMKITTPLVRVLRLVDGEKKPPMGYIYEAMDRAKETIKEAMGGQRYERRKWNVQLHQPLHAAGYILNPEFYYNNQDIEPCEQGSFGSSTSNLQKLALRILGLTCSASGCERNWSVFEHLHTKKRNRLEQKKLNDLVYVPYNQKLVERFNTRDSIDPITLQDIDDCNEWLIGSMQELVHEDDDLTWDQVAEASGANEQRTRHTRFSSHL
ncbi:hypothetical protein HHK36_014599 [Tetracentron sinense]|uniref:HAT C-terminal dimerisation domain-containing protein n=1 Tax=Tetracentron sinense TaxID=13715 RepID=A0A834Z4P9_TETSI|nr:hypothetical protein HHK36_014599 [Tetracentron sinense]